MCSPRTSRRRRPRAAASPSAATRRSISWSWWCSPSCCARACRSASSARLLETLRDQFSVRLFETIGGGGPLTLLTDGQEVYGRTSDGDLFNMLRDPQQPLLMLADVEGLRELGTARPRGRRKKKPKTASRAGAAQRDREDLVETVGRTSDDVNADELADAAGGGGAGVGRGLHRGDVAADDGGDQARRRPSASRRRRRSRSSPSRPPLQSCRPGRGFPRGRALRRAGLLP